MRLIKPSFEIIEQKPELDGLIRHIEICGRTCYKSEDKITTDSAGKFVQMLANRGHGAMLEHGTVYLKIPITSETLDRGTLSNYIHNKYSVSNGNGNDCYVTTNYRVLIENGWLDDLQYICEPTEYHEKRITVKFVCDRGVSHEFVRHRVFSFAQESTRYCNYSKSKFGNELTFIIPCWLDLKEGIYQNPDSFGEDQYLIVDECEYPYTDLNEGDSYFIQSLIDSENTYLSLTNLEDLVFNEAGYPLEKNWIAQQARSVLPNSLKTELIMTGTIEQWKGFFELRCDKAAHPQARELAIPLKKTFISNGYISE